MSQPIPRYRIDRFSAYGFTDDPKGKFCEYRDYAALAAENERLTRLLLDLSNAVHIHRANANTAKCCAEIDRIVHEVDTIFDIQ